MTTKHTPGPWRVEQVVPEPYRHGKYWVAHVDLGSQKSGMTSLGLEAAWPSATATVAPCLGLEGQPISREIVEANAHLIAAAPDLLAALEAAHGYLVIFGTDQLDHVRSVCRDAIAKAKGGKP